MRQQASLDYPSHLPPILDVLLLLLVIALFFVRSGWVSSATHWLETSLSDKRSAVSANSNLAGKRPQHLILLFGVGCLLHLLTLASLGPPTPWVSDEQAYLLGADTFASGRLTNPLPLLDPDLDRHFVQDHVLSAPTRQSKYPPGQSLLLSLGVLVGSPAFALTLAAGALAASLAWCLSAALSHSTATLGALVGLFWVGLGSYWNQSYWGGTLAAIGGALVLGSFLRLQCPASSGAPLLHSAVGFPFGLGIAILAITRPFEGLIYCLPFAAALLGSRLHRLRSGLATSRSEWIAYSIAIATTVAGLAWLGLYNRAVTGSAFTLPHLLYTNRGTLGSELFLWSASEGNRWLLEVPELFAIRLSKTLWFLLGTPLTLALLALAPLALRRRSNPTPAPRTVPQITNGVAVLCVLVAQALVLFWFPHYPAPAYAGLLLLALFGLERLATLSLFGRNWRAPLLLATVLCAVAGSLIRLPAQRIDREAESAIQEQLIDRLTAEGGKHLVLVDPAGQKNGFWVHNLADPLSQPVLWARSLEAKSDHRLVDRLDRKAWRLRFDSGGYTLVPFE